MVRRCLEGAVEPQIGAALFGEIEDVFGRAEPFAGSATTAAERETVLDAFFARCRWVRVSYLWRPNLRDEADNHLIELAVASGAGAVITHNGRDLNSGELRFPNLTILTPAEALRGFDKEPT